MKMKAGFAVVEEMKMKYRFLKRKWLSGGRWICAQTGVIRKPSIQWCASVSLKGLGFWLILGVLS